METDYLIVGSGLTGAVIANQLKEMEQDLIVVDRRSHMGGNVFDHYHPCGIRLHTYGPHYFRTNSEDIWKFVNKFSKFYKFEAILKTYVDGQYENWPIAGSYIKRVIGEHWEPDFHGKPSNFEEASLSKMPRLIYEKFVKHYTEKQWGVPAESLSVSLAGRFDVREDDEPRLKRQKHQGIPCDGYAVFMKNMLASVPVILNFDYLKHREDIRVKKMVIFSGAIDEFFDYEYGRLAYRGQEREHVYLPDTDYALPACQINNPDPLNGTHIRTLEWKRMLPEEYARRITGTVLTHETTVSPTNPHRYEYPFPDTENAQLYARYRERANDIKNLIICGRLGEYRYYDMDQVIVRALEISKKIMTGCLI